MSHHCEHGMFSIDEPECCICCDSPCGKVDVVAVMEHERAELQRERERHEAVIAYVLKHGKREEAPF